MHPVGYGAIEKYSGVKVSTRIVSEMGLVIGLSIVRDVAEHKTSILKSNLGFRIVFNGMIQLKIRTPGMIITCALEQCF